MSTKKTKGTKAKKATKKVVKKKVAKKKVEKVELKPQFDVSRLSDMMKGKKKMVTKFKSNLEIAKYCSVNGVIKDSSPAYVVRKAPMAGVKVGRNDKGEIVFTKVAKQSYNQIKYAKSTLAERGLK